MPESSVTNKTEMYRLLSRGQFGNTIPQFFSLEKWMQSPDHNKYNTWGVRTLAPGGPCRLYCPREEVEETVASFGQPVNISYMIDAVCTVTLWADVFDSDSGWLVYGVEYPPRGGSWRKLMPTEGRHWEGVAAKILLKKHLNGNSLDDLASVLEKYPSHTVELSATEECTGVIVGRNAVVWECRMY